MIKFEITLGGYDMEEVDRLVALIDGASDGPESRQEKHEALQSSRDNKFRKRFRGYAKIQVHNYIEERLREFSRDSEL